MTISVRLDTETKRILTRLARAQKVSQSEVVRRAIRAMAHDDESSSGVTVYDQIKDLIGKHGSGRSDLSQQGPEFIRQILLDKKRQGRL
jgi:Arc/MetJ-type ribon-helix-helix transcriptional regulator